MKLPKRVDTHVTETASWRLLQSVAPDEWIVREVSERDYGIDCYIEIASKDGHITGELVSAQLKGVEDLKWAGEVGKRTARSPSVKTSTANYWLNLPVPVFLLVADLPGKKVHYVSVMEHLRAQFGKLDSQETISFPLHEELHLASDVGKALFPWFVNKERRHAQLSFRLTNLLSHVEEFANFIRENQNRDTFIEVEAPRHLQFRSLYQACNAVSVFLEPKWDMESLPELYAMDHKEWKDDYLLLHEKTLDYALQKLEVIFPRLVRAALKLVTETQPAYWRARDPVFLSLCDSGELTWSLAELEHQAKHKKG
jgi:Domain of unknown function (DUF4365)